MAAELEFWRAELTGSRSRWPGLIAERSRKNRPLSAQIRSLINSKPGDTVSILDVGSGPLTVLGTFWEDRLLSVTAADPLADLYLQVLSEAGISPPTPLIKCDAEHLVDHFGTDRFDLVFCHNALDHALDPVLGMTQMLQVVKPGRTVRLEHAINEGEREHYEGLHQWNFCERDGAFTIWNRRGSIDASAVLKRLAAITVHSTPDWITVTLTRF